MSIISVYFVKTELELLCSEIIARSYDSKSYNIVAHQIPIPVQTVEQAFDAAIPFIMNKSNGYFSNYSSMQASLTLIADRIRSHEDTPRQIKVHLPRISTSKSNFAINFLSKAFPSSEVMVCIIPHGMVSIDIIPLSYKKRLKHFKRRYGLNRIFFPKLKYYAPKTDLIGILDDKVRYVYTFKGMERNYPSEKVRLLEIPLREDIENRKKIAVVVGQPLLKDGFATQSSVELIKQQILSWVTENNFDVVYYSKHPRATTYLDFYHEDYVILEQQGAIEPLLCEMQPDAIISCYSTALAIGKSLLGQKIRCVSIGLEHTTTDKKKELREHFESAEIECL